MRDTLIKYFHRRENDVSPSKDALDDDRAWRGDDQPAVAMPQKGPAAFASGHLYWRARRFYYCLSWPPAITLTSRPMPERIPRRVRVLDIRDTCTSALRPRGTRH